MKAKFSLVAFGIFLTATSSAASAQEQQAPGPQQGQQGPRPPVTCLSRFRGDPPKIAMCEEMREQDSALMAEAVAAKGERVQAAKTARNVRRAQKGLGWAFPVPAGEAMFALEGLVGINHQYVGLLPGQDSVRVDAGAMARILFGDYMNVGLWLRVNLDVPSSAFAAVFRDPEPAMPMMSQPQNTMGGNQPTLSAELTAAIAAMNRTTINMAGGVEARIAGYGQGMWRGIGGFAGLGGDINPSSFFAALGISVNFRWFSLRGEFDLPLAGAWKNLENLRQVELFGGGDFESAKKVRLSLTFQFLGLGG